MRLAMMEREGTEPAHLTWTWRVIVTENCKAKVVVEGESYQVASQLTDALNAMFEVPGPLSAVGRGVTGEVREMAENIYRELEVEGCRS